MPGDLDPLYVVARQVLLDGLEALGKHKDSLVLVGAQAIYLHTGNADVAIAPYTTDADLTLDPQKLGPLPKLGELMNAAGFRPGKQPGIWVTMRNVGSRPHEVALDLLVPDSLGGGGRRGARLPSHGNDVARKAKGLEAVLVDNGAMDISALDRADHRSVRVLVAGPSALLVAKLHKLGEREDAAPERLKPKDAHDVLRLLRSISTDTFAAGFEKLRGDALSAAVTIEAIEYLRNLFSLADALGPELAARAVAGLEPADVIKESCAVLANDLLRRL